MEVRCSCHHHFRNHDPLPCWKDIHVVASSTKNTIFASTNSRRTRISTRAATRTGDLSAININNSCRTQGGWNAARQRVVEENHLRELGQQTKLRWKRTRQLVVGETQVHEFQQETKLGCTKGTCQLVLVEIQLRELDQEIKL